jgi:hypothetical protein
MIYIDNYFISIPLFSELRACKFGTIGTTRLHKEFPMGLKELKTRFSIKLVTGLQQYKLKLKRCITKSKAKEGSLG